MQLSIRRICMPSCSFFVQLFWYRCATPKGWIKPLYDACSRSSLIEYNIDPRNLNLPFSSMDGVQWVNIRCHENFSINHAVGAHQTAGNSNTHTLAHPNSLFVWLAHSHFLKLINYSTKQPRWKSFTSVERFLKIARLKSLLSVRCTHAYRL